MVPIFKRISQQKYNEIHFICVYHCSLWNINEKYIMEYLSHVTLKYIDPSTGHNFVQLIPGVTTSSSNDLRTPSSH